MRTNKPSITFTSLDQELVHLKRVLSDLQNCLAQARPATLPEQVYENLKRMHQSAGLLRQKVDLLEEERHNLQLMLEVGHFVNSSLNLDTVLQIIMDTIIEITGAERGFLMLRSSGDEMFIQLARNWEKTSIDPADYAFSTTIVNRVLSSRSPILTTNAREDPRFGSQKSVANNYLRSVLCVPLAIKDDLIGVIYADNRIRVGMFTRRELDMLADFANQAAVAIENARLFASVAQSLVEVTELKKQMDSILGSITSTVLAADANLILTSCNPAARQLLRRTSEELVGQPFEMVLPDLAKKLGERINFVMRMDLPVTGEEYHGRLVGTDLVDLRVSLSPLKDADGKSNGVTIVLEDLTEQKQLEAQQRMFARMVSPAVIGQLDPDRLQLGGQRQEISVLFADLRAFTGFSAEVAPEELVKVLNCYLAAAADAILEEGGTIDKFLGDAVMAWFNAPLPQPDHTLRAARAAIAIQMAIRQLHLSLPERSHLSFGIGIHTGEAILGLVGSEQRLEYTAVGDTVNTAKRIQESAAGGQILISQQAYDRIEKSVVVASVDPIQAKGKRESVAVYELLCLDLPA